MRRALYGTTVFFLFVALGFAASDKKPALTAPEQFMGAARPVVGLHFDKDRADSGPEGLRFDVAGQTACALPWVVRKDSQALTPPHVLTSMGDVNPEGVSLALMDRPDAQNGIIDLHFMAVSGGSHFAAGVVWRWSDAKNFYILEANSTDDALRLYRWKKGKAKLIDEKMAIVTANRWHTLRVVFLLQTYAIYLDDDVAMAGKDSSLIAPGAVGLAAYGDSVIRFDDVSLKQ